MAKQIIINFNADGTSTSIYDENLDLSELGKVSISRASHVEPTDDGQWTADMSPIGGPVLGPFKKRSTALEEEVKWINENHLKFAGIAQ